MAMRVSAEVGGGGWVSALGPSAAAILSARDCQSSQRERGRERNRVCQLLELEALKEAMTNGLPRAELVAIVARPSGIGYRRSAGECTKSARKSGRDSVMATTLRTV